MARIVKRRKRRIRPVVKFAIFFVCWCIFSLVIKTTNDRYAIEIQQKQREIETLKQENEDLEITIRGLLNKDYVFAVAEKYGLKENVSSVIRLELSN